MRNLSKKLTLLSAIMCMSAAGTAMAADTTDTQYTTDFGNVVADGKVDVLDMEAIQKDILSIKTLDDDAADNADVNRDGVVDVTDLEAVQKQVLKISEIENINVIKTNGTVSVHDPSIVQDKDGTYYIFGSHMAWAKSTDLCNWTTFTNNINTDYETIFATEAEWAAKASSSYDVSGNLWAPDVIWNETMNKWCMYMSINGADWNSTISLLTADKLDGNWTYVGPVIQSGMSKGYGVTFDYTKVTGETTVNSRYTSNIRNKIPTYEPHAIDPCVLYDDDGNLWMTYGSWSGGIGMIKLSNKTGLRDYDYTYTYDETTLTDPYTGYKIAGGNGVSGEASYIQKIGTYYYLFVTYGGLTSTGGYNMRVFRSEDITGPYVDESEDYARYKLTDKVIGSTGVGTIGGTVGMRLMSYYKWSTMDVAQVAQGHNSAFVDTDGKAYLVYHTRTNDGTEGHYVKVHQLFVNEDGWLVTAPYRYSGETLNESGYSVSQVAGSYEVLMQKQSVDYANLEYVSPVTINLGTDGKVTGDYTGTWSLTANSPYITVTLGGKEYKGVVIRQIIEGTDEDTMCFTLVGTTDEMAVWGSKYLTGKRGIKMAIDKLTVASIALDDLTLPTVGAQNVQISWKSSNPEIIATDGTLTLPEKETTVTLTATFTSKGVSESKTYDVKVYEAVEDDADEYVVAKYYTNETLDLSSAKEGDYKVANPFNSDNTSGLEIYNGAAIEFDVAHTGSAVTMLNTIFAFTDSGNGKLYFTEGSYLGYNATGGYYDANIENYGLVTDYIGTKAKVRIDFLPTGYEVRINGTLVYSNETVDSGDTKGSKDITGYNYVLKWLNESATTLNFGWGSWWVGSYQGTISNVVCYAKTVEKVDTSQYVYYQDYRKGDTSEWTAQDTGLTIANDGDSRGKYLYYGIGKKSTNGNRGAYAAFNLSDEITGNYTISVDTALTAGVQQNRANAAFVILGTDAKGYKDSSGATYTAATSGYILKLYNAAPTPEKDENGNEITTDNNSLQKIWYINDTDKYVTIPVGEWVNITADVNTTAGTADVVITYLETGEVLYNGTVSINGSGSLYGLQLVRARNIGTMAVDNITVKKNDSTESDSQAAASSDSSTTVEDEKTDSSSTTTTTSSETATTGSNSSNNSSVTATVTIGKGNGSSSSASGSTGTTSSGTSTTDTSSSGTTSSETASNGSTSSSMNLVYGYEEANGERFYYVAEGSTASGSIKVPDTVTVDGKTYSVVGIGKEAFLDQKQLVSIELPDTITYISYGAFEGCSALTSIVIPKSVTSIDQYAFYNCENLTTVTFKSANTYIDEQAFDGCTSLTTVHATGTAKTGMEAQLGYLNNKLTYIIVD